MGDNFIISRHDALTNLGGFSALTSIGGNFRIGGNSLSIGNDVLTTFGGFSALNTIGGTILIRYNPMLSNCSSLPPVIDQVRDAGEVTISNNAGGCGSVTLTTQAQVTALSLDAVTIFTGNITINEASDSTDPITDLSVFSNITEIRGNLFVSSTKSITTLSHETSAGSGEHAFDALETITGNFNVGNALTTTSLTNTGNFPNLNNIGGNFDIHNNAALSTIDTDNFPALASVGGGFNITRDL